MKNKDIEELLNEFKKGTHLFPEYREIILSYIKQLKEEIVEYEFLIKTQNNREYRSKFLKEFQKERGKNVFPDYDEIYKRYDKLKEENKQLENNRDKAIEYIENDILDNKINEVDWDYDEYYYSDMPAERIKPLIDILKGDSDE